MFTPNAEINSNDLNEIEELIKANADIFKHCKFGINEKSVNHFSFMLRLQLNLEFPTKGKDITTILIANYLERYKRVLDAKYVMDEIIINFNCSSNLLSVLKKTIEDIRYSEHICWLKQAVAEFKELMSVVEGKPYNEVKAFCKELKGGITNDSEVNAFYNSQTFFDLNYKSICVSIKKDDAGLAFVDVYGVSIYNEEGCVTEEDIFIGKYLTAKDDKELLKMYLDFLKSIK